MRIVRLVKAARVQGREIHSCYFVPPLSIFAPAASPLPSSSTWSHLEGGGKESFEDVAFEDRSPTSPYPTINFSWRDNENVAVNGDKMSLASSVRNPSVSIGSSENAIFKFVGSTSGERGNILWMVQKVRQDSIPRDIVSLLKEAV